MVRKRISRNKAPAPHAHSAVLLSLDLATPEKTGRTKTTIFAVPQRDDDADGDWESFWQRRATYPLLLSLPTAGSRSQPADDVERYQRRRHFSWCVNIAASSSAQK